MNDKIELIDNLIKKINDIGLPTYRDFSKAYEKSKLYIENFSILKKQDLLFKLDFTKARRLKRTRPKRAIRKKKRKANIIHYKVNRDILLTSKINDIIDILKILRDELEVDMIEGISTKKENLEQKFEYIDDLGIKEELVNRYSQIFKLASYSMYKLG